MELAHLRTFLEVARRQGISKAAEALFLTQPTVTARIQALEQEVGEALFERSGRGVSLTPAGRTLLPYAERALGLLQEAREALERARRGVRARLHLGTARAIGTYVLPRILERFRAAYPGIDLTIKTGRSHDVLEMVLREEVEVGLTRSLAHPEIESVHLYDEEIVPVVAPSHPFAEAAAVSLAEIAQEPLILYDPGSTYYLMITNACREAGIVPNVVMQLDSIEATKKMIERGLGISLLPLNSLDREVQLGTLAFVPIAGGVNVRLPTAVIYRRARHLGYALRSFLGLLGDLYGVASLGEEAKREGASGPPGPGANPVRGG